MAHYFAKTNNFNFLNSKQIISNKNQLSTNHQTNTSLNLRIKLTNYNVSNNQTKPSNFRKRNN